MVDPTQVGSQNPQPEQPLSKNEGTLKLQGGAISHKVSTRVAGRPGVITLVALVAIGLVVAGGLALGGVFPIADLANISADLAQGLAGGSIALGGAAILGIALRNRRKIGALISWPVDRYKHSRDYLEGQKFSAPACYEGLEEERTGFHRTIGASVDEDDLIPVPRGAAKTPGEGDDSIVIDKELTNQLEASTLDSSEEEERKSVENKRVARNLIFLNADYQLRRPLMCDSSTIDALIVSHQAKHPVSKVTMHNLVHDISGETKNAEVIDENKKLFPLQQKKSQGKDIIFFTTKGLSGAHVMKLTVNHKEKRIEFYDSRGLSLFERSRQLVLRANCNVEEMVKRLIRENDLEEYSLWENLEKQQVDIFSCGVMVVNHALEEMEDSSLYPDKEVNQVIDQLKNMTLRENVRIHNHTSPKECIHDPVQTLPDLGEKTGVDVVFVSEINELYDFSSYEEDEDLSMRSRLNFYIIDHDNHTIQSIHQEPMIRKGKGLSTKAANDEDIRISEYGMSIEDFKNSFKYEDEGEEKKYAYSEIRPAAPSVMSRASHLSDIGDDLEKLGQTVAHTLAQKKEVSEPDIKVSSSSEVKSFDPSTIRLSSKDKIENRKKILRYMGLYHEPS